MPRLKIQYGFLFLIAVYAVISWIPLHFSSRGVIVVATIGYDFLSIFVSAYFIAFVVLRIKSNRGSLQGEKRDWRWFAVRFIMSFVLTCFILICMLKARNVALLPPSTWNRPQFALGWPFPWYWESLGCDMFGWVLLLDVLFYLSLSFLICGFCKPWFHVAVCLLPILLIVGAAMLSGEDGLADLYSALFSSRHPRLN